MTLNLHLCEPTECTVFLHDGMTLILLFFIFFFLVWNRKGWKTSGGVTACVCEGITAYAVEFFMPNPTEMKVPGIWLVEVIASTRMEIQYHSQGAVQRVK